MTYKYDKADERRPVNAAIDLSSPTAGNAIESRSDCHRHLDRLSEVEHNLKELTRISNFLEGATEMLLPQDGSPPSPGTLRDLSNGLATMIKRKSERGAKLDVPSREDRPPPNMTERVS